mgnify:CR=1 FL=1
MSSMLKPRSRLPWLFVAAGALLLVERDGAADAQPTDGVEGAGQQQGREEAFGVRAVQQAQQVRTATPLGDEVVEEGGQTGSARRRVGTVIFIETQALQGDRQTECNRLGVAGKDVIDQVVEAAALVALRRQHAGVVPATEMVELKEGGHGREFRVRSS